MSVSAIIFLFTVLSTIHFSAPFVPEDYYQINCGSSSNISVDNRIFLGDSAGPGSNFLNNAKSSLAATNLSIGLPLLYSTARVFKTISRYSFPVRKNGIHIVRLHISPFATSEFNLISANFSVSISGIVVLDIFNTEVSVLKEYMLSVGRSAIELVFSPVSDSSLAFVNAIEVFSAPDDLILGTGVRFVAPDGVQEYKNLTGKVLETIYRVNVGGPKLTPFNDTLWRIWEPDESFLVLKSAAKRAFTTHPPNYRSGGADEGIAPGKVYMTAQQMNTDNLNAGSMFNISWDFPVDPDGQGHLIRLHFCDIVSVSLNQLYFNVFIDGYLAYMDLDLSLLTYHLLASPYYVDFVLGSTEGGGVRVSVGPSDLSNPLRRNAILNGVEIFKIVNFDRTMNKRKQKHTFRVILLGMVGFSFLCVAVFPTFIALKCRKKDAKATSPFGKILDATDNLSPVSRLQIPYSDIKLATKNFDMGMVVGSGGFGTVYRGVLKDKTEVAVKRGVPGSRQGLSEFQAEISVLSRIRHCHLVSLIGYCEENSEMILVYEYVENGALKKHLYGSESPPSPPLSWKQRLEICIGAARGLHYLHTGSAHGIIHRDVKSSNILLDKNFAAKVSDFGLSRTGPCTGDTHVSTDVKGSFGYLDPEYFRVQRLTEKSDVYSFGVVLLEVLCGRPAVDPQLAREQVNLAEWANDWLKNGLLKQIVDPSLVPEITTASLNKFGEITLNCLSSYGIDRPSMGEVLWNLEQALVLQQSEELQNYQCRRASAPEFRVSPSICRTLSTGSLIEIQNGSCSSEQ